VSAAINPPTISSSLIPASAGIQDFLLNRAWLARGRAEDSTHAATTSLLIEKFGRAAARSKRVSFHILKLDFLAPQIAGISVAARVPSTFRLHPIALAS
jgi:hypothetical protein